jgi:hypothetical protein
MVFNKRMLAILGVFPTDLVRYFTRNKTPDFQSECSHAINWVVRISFSGQVFQQLSPVLSLNWCDVLKLTVTTKWVSLQTGQICLYKREIFLLFIYVSSWLCGSYLVTVVRGLFLQTSFKSSSRRETCFHTFYIAISYSPLQLTLRVDLIL